MADKDLKQKNAALLRSVKSMRAHIESLDEDRARIIAEHEADVASLKAGQMHLGVRLDGALAEARDRRSVIAALHGARRSIAATDEALATTLRQLGALS